VKPTTTYAAPLAHRYLDLAIGDHHHNAILDHLLAEFGIRAGDPVLELGAGTGRYTAMLLARGLRVTVLEPDPALAEKLRGRLGVQRDLTLASESIAECRWSEVRVRLVCGFHVLHHLDRETLVLLEQGLARLAAAGAGFAGWFFLEPNPRNPLYPLQILLTPGMRFAEERGIWRNDYESLGTPGGGSVRLGTLGLFPPRALVGHLPGSIQRLATRLSRSRAPHRLYAVYGARTRPS
jgi:hypothetical protein